MKKTLLYVLAICLAAGQLLAAEPVVAPDEPTVPAQYKLDGAWYGASDYDPSEIGPNNFQTLKNMRYGAKHPEGVSGYTVLNETPISTYVDLKQGIHLKTNRDSTSHVIVSGMNAGGTASQLYYSTDAIPGAITFTALTTGRASGGTGTAFNDTTGNDPRLASIPQRQIVYSNEEVSYIYGGPQMDAAGVWLIDGNEEAVEGATNASPIVVTITGHPYSTGDTVSIYGVAGNTAANGTWVITKVGADTFSLDDSTGDGAYTSGGRAFRDEDMDNPRDYWDKVKNSLSSDTVTIAAATTDVLTVHSTRPLHGVWFTVTTPNASASTLTCHEWTSSGWVLVTNASDGTTDGGIALAQSGAFVFDSTVSTAARKHFENTYFFAYRFRLSAGSAVVSHVQVDAPFQPIVDVWDGVPRNAIYAGINFSGDDEDFTAHVVETSTTSVPIGLLLDGLTATDEAYFIFEDKTTAVQITMLANLVNTAARTIAVKYWDGDSWAAVSNLVDGTLDTAGGTKTFNKSGLISWTPPATEFPYTLGKVTGWAYQFVPSGALSGTHGDATDSVVVDTVTGIPSPLDVGPYKFHSQYKGRHLGCGAVSDKEGNRVDFTPPFAPDVWNGFMSSNNKTQSVYLETDEDLTAGASLYNRYGSVDRLFEVWVGFSDSHTFQIKESGEDTSIFNVDTISKTVGCPAPRTLTSVGIGYDSVMDGAKRNVLLWLDSSGPYSYDGSYPDPIPGIEKYFDQNDSLYVGADLSEAHAWLDPVYREWNLVLPGDVWVVYDLVKKKWYQKDAGTAYTPTCGFNVVDSNGSKYSYAGLESGEVARLEYGYTWDGAAIDQEFKTGDFWPSENIWEQTLVRRLKLAAISISEEHDIEIDYESDTGSTATGAFTYFTDGAFTYYDGEFSQIGTTVSTMTLNATGSERLVRTTTPRNDLAWSHAYGFKVSTSDTAKGFQPVGWGIEYRVVRSDH